MKKLWQKSAPENDLVEQYTSGENVELDNKLIAYDAYGTIAHTNMLMKIGILTVAEFNEIRKELVNIIDNSEKGAFHVSYGDEDVHTKIENWISHKLGPVGQKIHTGRSRNDQVLLDLRLFTKQSLFDVAGKMILLADAFCIFAKQNEFIAMPGYTHMQKAMPSSVGLWSGSFVESLLADLHSCSYALNMNDQNPLGSGASYGVSLPIDRNLTSRLLGFKNTQQNVLYAQMSRPKSHLSVMEALVQIMLTMSRFAQDMLIFTTSEFNFFELPDELCTGSSIMPQKKNVDIMEILRARTHQIISNYGAIASISGGLPSGYNSDFQETKKALMDSLGVTSASLQVVKLTVSVMKVNELVLEKANTNELYATHAAYKLVKQGMPFREAYQKIAELAPRFESFDYDAVIHESAHLGAPGNLNLQFLNAEIEKERKEWLKRENDFKKTLVSLKGGMI